MIQTMSLSDFVEINPKVPLEKGKEYPFVAMEDIVPGQRYISATCDKRYAGGGAKFQVGDVLFARITPCLENGKIAQFAGADGQLGFGSTEFFIFRAKDRVSDPAYVFYLAYTDIVRKPAEKSMSGASGRQRADLNAVRNLEVPTPPLTTQRKIAAILSAYDDLIENNTRRIKILEEMAQMIYQEWFVRFRFPGHEKVKMVESELGMILEGWEPKPIGEVIQTLGGSTPSTKNPEYWENGDVVWFIPTDLTKSGSMFVFDSEKKITRLGLKNSSAKLFPAYSVMMTSRATIGVTAINTKEACTNQAFITCIPNNRLSLYHIYFWIQENLEKITSIASGATYKEINRTEFRSLPIVVPNGAIERIFLEVVAPIGKQIEVLLAKDTNLRRTRDLLLPRLISGEIDVENLDIDTGAVSI